MARKPLVALFAAGIISLEACELPLRESGTVGARCGHGMRWAAGRTFSAEKRIFGESVMAKRIDLMYREAMAKFAV